MIPQEVLDWLVPYLDMVDEDPKVEEYKAKLRALLQVHEGGRYLDIGPGLGHEVIRLANMVGKSGLVYGLELEQQLIDIAGMRIREAGLSERIKIFCSDAHKSMQFRFNEFDGAFADRMLQHTEDPSTIICNMIDYVKPGGMVVAAEANWQTLTISGPATTGPGMLTSKLVQRFRTDFVPNTEIAADLKDVFEELGLEDVQMYEFPRTFTRYEAAREMLLLDLQVTAAVGGGVITDPEAALWKAHMAEAEEFNCSFTTYVVAGMVA